MYDVRTKTSFFFVEIPSYMTKQIDDGGELLYFSSAT